MQAVLGGLGPGWCDPVQSKAFDPDCRPLAWENGAIFIIFNVVLGLQGALAKALSMPEASSGQHGSGCIPQAHG